MEVKVIHLKRLIILLLLAIPISYAAWGVGYCMHHHNAPEEGAIGLIAVFGCVVAGIFACLLLALIIYGMHELYVWIEKSHNDDNTLFTLRKPHMPDLTPAKNLFKAAVKHIMPKGKPVIKEFDDEDA